MADRALARRPNKASAAPTDIRRVSPITLQPVPRSWLYEFQHTLTTRPGFTSKVVYDYNNNVTFMSGIWYEHASQKQEEPYTLVNADGTPCNQDPTNDVAGPCSLMGTSFYGSGPVVGYNDKVDSTGRALYGEISSRFLDDALKLTVGLTWRGIHRSDHTYQPVCADNPAMTYQPGSTTKTCLSVATTTTFTNSAAYTFFGGTPGMTAAQEQAVYQKMQNYAVNPIVNYNRVLPEFLVSYDFSAKQQVFASIATGMKTPATNNLWTYNSAGTVMELTDIRPETSTSYEAGYRYHDDFVQASATFYLQALRTIRRPSKLILRTTSSTISVA